MKISNIIRNLKISNSEINKKNNDKNNINQEANIGTSITNVYPQNYYLINFQARVDKNMERFFGVNKDLMPMTVIDYINNLNDTSSVTPLEAHKNAYIDLYSVKNVEEIKTKFPKESLFENIKSIDDSKATRGIIRVYRMFKDDLQKENKSILSTGEDFTVYLVKKVFLENKTIKEINKDLENDLDETFKSLFLSESKEGQFVYDSTLKTLGIKAPIREYRHSLRYTQFGYSDEIGERISDAQKLYWELLPEEERIGKNKVRILNLENWWSSLTTNEKLEMLAAQDAEIEMLNKYKSFEKQKKSKEKIKAENVELQSLDKTERKNKRNHIGSTKLKEDKLFKLWATKNLEIYAASLSEAEKDSLFIKRSRNAILRWKEMSPAERTEYISKMKEGGELSRYVMLDAWNNNLDIIKDLSLYLKEEHYSMLDEILFSDKAFSEVQSNLMTEFWTKNPQHAENLGKSIHDAHVKIENAISNGTFDVLKTQINRSKEDRIRKINEFKKLVLQTLEKARLDKKEEASIITEMKIAMVEKLINESEKFEVQNYPKSFYIEIVNAILDDISNEDKNNLINSFKSDKELFYNVLSQNLKKTTLNKIELLNNSIKTASTLVLIERKKFNKDEKLVLNNNESLKLEEWFQKLKEPLTEKRIDEIIHNYFKCDNESLPELKKALAELGETANILFSEKYKSIRPVIKEYLSKQFEKERWNKIKNVKCMFSPEKEAIIKTVTEGVKNRFNFIPSEVMYCYLNEFARKMRFINDNDFWSRKDEIMKFAKKRTFVKEIAKLIILPKYEFSEINKLKMLAMEQILAERLFEITEEPKVFGLQFEQLLDNFELFSINQTIPSQPREFKINNTDTLTLKAIRRLDKNGLKNEYNYCLEEIFNNFLNKNKGQLNVGKLESLVKILANDETRQEILEQIAKRISYYHLR